MRVLITGGAGFVGSSLARCYRERHPAATIVALDNLHRRGSELNVPLFEKQGIAFVHGDVRTPESFEGLEGSFDVVVDAAAEPSVHAGLDGASDYVVRTNLGGTINLLEFARRRAGAVVFLSSSRVYSIDALRRLALREAPRRFELEEHQPIPGVTARGIDESFSTSGPRSLYGTTKLASELLVEEYATSLGLRAVIDRCGVLAGAGQFGTSEQGVVALWVAAHLYERPLRYTGFGGEGKQVRDVLHPRDLFELIERQVSEIDAISGATYNVGGGADSAVSLAELSDHCRKATDAGIEIGSVPETGPVDVPLYVTDATRARERFAWSPRVGIAEIVEEIACWLRERDDELRPLFHESRSDRAIR
jgi:CDP-paratose 2-epimerase